MSINMLRGAVTDLQIFGVFPIRYRKLIYVYNIMHNISGVQKNANKSVTCNPIGLIPTVSTKVEVTHFEKICNQICNL